MIVTMLVSRIMWQPPLLTSTSITNLLSKLYIIQWTLFLLKLNSSLLDMASTKLLIVQGFLKLSSSQIPFILWKEFLILLFICSKYILYLSQMNSENFFFLVLITQSNFGNFQVTAIGCFIKWWIGKPNNSTKYLYFLVNCLGTLIRRISETI